MLFTIPVFATLVSLTVSVSGSPIVERAALQNNTTAPKDSTTTPKADTTAPKAETTAPKADTTAPKANTTAPKDGTTAPKDNTTASSKGAASAGAAPHFVIYADNNVPGGVPPVEKLAGYNV
jgi:hypothetical protein